MSLSHALYVGPRGGSTEGGELQVQLPPDASMALSTCPDLLGGLEKGDLFLRLLRWGWSAALSHVLPHTTLASSRPTFHAPHKLLRHDTLAVLALEPLEISPSELGNNPGAQQAH